MSINPLGVAMAKEKREIILLDTVRLIGRLRRLRFHYLFALQFPITNKAEELAMAEYLEILQVGNNELTERGYETE